MEVFGNPSSTHGEGRKAKAIIESVRKAIAERLNCLPGNRFTGSGTEADNWALFNRCQCATWAFSTSGGTSALEHHAVSHMAEYV